MVHGRGGGVCWKVLSCPTGDTQEMSLSRYTVIYSGIQMILIPCNITKKVLTTWLLTGIFVTYNDNYVTSSVFEKGIKVKSIFLRFYIQCV